MLQAISAPNQGKPVEQRQVKLPTGILTVLVEQADLGLDELCDFAARRNPKRGFLFVSRVLGKHIPVSPKILRDSYQRLAAKINADLPGPIVFVGMAETATALGHGVYEEYVRATGRQDLVFIHTTRYELDRPKALNFREEHSHATDHILYTPEDVTIRALFENARSLVLVDDEASTGKTFVNLARSFAAEVSALEELVTVVITDWRGEALVEQRQRQLLAEIGVRTSSVSLLSGRHSFQPDEALKLVELPRASGNGDLKDHLFKANHGRLGLGDPMVLHRTMNAVDIKLQPYERCLVLGVGEFAYLPILLAERLERDFPEAIVAVQSTTRSPIMEGGAIRQSLRFSDHCEEGIENFLHNGSAEHFDRVIICTETPGDRLAASLVQTLGAQIIEL